MRQAPVTISSQLGCDPGVGGDLVQDFGNSASLGRELPTSKSLGQDPGGVHRHPGDIEGRTEAWMGVTTGCGPKRPAHQRGELRRATSAYGAAAAEVEDLAGLDGCPHPSDLADDERSQLDRQDGNSRAPGIRCR